MSEPIAPDLISPGSWVQVYSEQRVAQSVSANEFYPIPPYFVSILLHSPLLVVGTVSNDARATWRLGGYLQQFIDAPDTDFLEIPTKKQFIPLNSFTLCRYPQWTTAYKLRFQVPSWIREIRLIIYEYQGTLTDSTEELVTAVTDLIRVDLTRIETKVDAL